MCKQTGKRWNAKNLLGNPYPYYEEGEDYNEDLGCKGCYQYDPVAYRIQSIRRVIQETSQDLMQKLYPDIMPQDT